MQHRRAPAIALGIGAVALLSVQVAAQERRLTPAGVQVIAKVHHANQMEIKAGHLAAEKAQAERVRQYGRLLVRDHSNADRKIIELAREHGVETIPPPTPDTPAEQQQAQKPQQMLQHLQTVSPAAFDRAFTAAMIQAHKHAIGMLRQGIDKASDEELEDLLADLVPILEQHLDIAQELHAAVTANAP